jgi:hypothetical protein
MAGALTAGAAGVETGPPVITAGATGTDSPPDGPAGVPVALGGVSTGACAEANDSPHRAGADTGGGAANGGGACGGSRAASCPIACIAPSVSDCAPAAAGCPVAIPVMNDCPIGPGSKPCPTAAGDMGALGIPGAPGAIGAPITGGVPGAGGAVGGPDGAPAPPRVPLPPNADVGAAVPGGPLPGDSGPFPRNPSLLTACCGEERSSLPIWRGGGTSSVLKPCSLAHFRASPPIPWASRIFCVAAMILSTAVRLALAASALHRAWMACTSANCSGRGFFDART